MLLRMVDQIAKFTPLTVPEFEDASEFPRLPQSDNFVFFYCNDTAEGDLSGKFPDLSASLIAKRPLTYGTFLAARGAMPFAKNWSFD